MILERTLNAQNQRIADLIKVFEGLYLTAYLCSAGVATIGFGSTGRDVKLGMKVSRQWAEDRLLEDVNKFAQGVTRLCPNVNENQLCALTSFAYNLGLTALKNSTLRKKINDGDIESAKVQILRWNKAGGRVLKGLTKRRQIEASLLG